MNTHEPGKNIGHPKNIGPAQNKSDEPDLIQALFMVIGIVVMGTSVLWIGYTLFTSEHANQYASGILSIGFIVFMTGLGIWILADERPWLVHGLPPWNVPPIRSREETIFELQDRVRRPRSLFLSFVIFFYLLGCILFGLLGIIDLDFKEFLALTGFACVMLVLFLFKYFYYGINRTGE